MQNDYYDSIYFIHDFPPDKKIIEGVLRLERLYESHLLLECLLYDRCPILQSLLYAAVIFGDFQERLHNLRAQLDIIRMIFHLAEEGFCGYSCEGIIFDTCGLHGAGEFFEGIALITGYIYFYCRFITNTTISGGSIYSFLIGVF